MNITVQCPGCQRAYSVKEEHAGRNIQCPQCKEIIQVPRPAPAQRLTKDPDPYVPTVPRRAPAPEPDLHPSFDADRFLLRQQHFSISQKYVVSDKDGEPVLFVQRPTYFLQTLGAVLAGLVAGATVIGGSIAGAVALDQMPLTAFLSIFGVILGIVAIVVIATGLRPKRHVSFYSDETKEELLLQVLQDKKFYWPFATYTCLDEDGEVLCLFVKNYFHNIFRKRWEVRSPRGELILIAMEDSVFNSIMRRIFSGGIVRMLMPTNFIFIRPDTKEEIGQFNRKITILDRYVLDLFDDEEMYLDRRIGVALGVMLDTGEHR